MVAPRPIELKEWAYGRIKQRILDNSLPADTQINIDEVAAELGISRTPVREALIQLQNNGLVRIVPRVGCFVNRITRKEFQKIPAAMAEDMCLIAEALITLGVMNLTNNLQVLMNP